MRKRRSNAAGRKGTRDPVVLSSFEDGNGESFGGSGAVEHDPTASPSEFIFLGFTNLNVKIHCNTPRTSVHGCQEFLGIFQNDRYASMPGVCGLTIQKYPSPPRLSLSLPLIIIIITCNPICNVICKTTTMTTTTCTAISIPPTHVSWHHTSTKVGQRDCKTLRSSNPSTCLIL